MEIKIMSFGKLSEFIGDQTIKLTGIGNTDDLKKYLEETFPVLRSTKYKIALNSKFVQENCLMSNNDTVAIMPPFSGG